MTLRFSLPPLGEDIAVLTPNQRLAASLRRDHDHAQRAAGRQAWPTADFVAWPFFLQRVWQAVVWQGDKDERLLTAHEAQCLWESTVLREASASLLSVAETAREARNVWQVAHAWRLLQDLAASPRGQDGDVFLTWCRRYRQTCTMRGFVDEAMLPDALGARLTAASGVLPRRLLLAGFDIVTPQQTAFLDACRRLGTAVDWLQSDRLSPAVSLQRAAFATEADERLACAAWVRRHLEMQPSSRIGIVVPRLEQMRGHMERTLAEVLAPAWRMATGRAQETSKLYNVSLGPALSRYGLIDDALALLRFSLGRPLPWQTVSALIRSPFIGAAAAERNARARWDRVLAERTAVELGIDDLREALGRRSDATVASLRSRLAAVAQVAAHAAIATSPSRRGLRRDPAAWSRVFAALLDAWGFPGEAGLDSRDYQLLAKWHECLAALAGLGSVLRQMTADEALIRLQRLAADTVFQPEQGGDAPVQVLGVLESAGQAFDALWVMGLDESVWPVPLRPYPFIPAQAQRRARLPEACADVSLVLDRAITQGWRHAARDVVFSHALVARGEDVVRAASILVRDVPLSASLDVPPSLVARLAAPAQTVLQPIPDRSIVWPSASALQVRGGTAVLRDFAACPFRAFARHRLGATGMAVPIPGLGPRERGILVHRTLALIWETLGTRAALDAMDAAAACALAETSAARALGEWSARDARRLGARFASIERQRIVSLACAWLALERMRERFAVVEVETSRKVRIGRLEMHVRLDRLDRFTDGSHALIDYKTGEARIADWWGARPDEPQLPIYLFGSERLVSALAFACLKRGRRFGFVGVAARDDLLPGVKAVQQVHGAAGRGHDDWPALVDGWRETLAALAEGFAEGLAEVDPKYAGQTCAQCDLQGLCRIAESRSPANDEEEAPAADA